uniref:Uncharacterized protein n=1 Tax=Rhizophora mucronata TaxID=61149 RepID=A0A2P2PRM8_RHIMU
MISPMFNASNFKSGDHMEKPACRNFVSEWNGPHPPQDHIPHDEPSKTRF